MRSPTRAPASVLADIDTPLGVMRARVSARGLCELRFAAASGPGESAVADKAAQAHLDAARRWLDLYWQGRDPAGKVDVVLDLRGTPFQLAVWARLRAIAWGRTTSYGDIAAQLRPPTAARAAGAAIGRNPAWLVVPCHRVVGKDGALTGYAGGLERKHALLVHEGVLSA